MNEFSKATGYKINTQKSLTFLYTNNENSEREIKKLIPFTIATKIINYLRIYPPKEAKNYKTENYKMLMKEIKDNTNRCKDIRHCWIGMINIVKMTILTKITILTKAIYKFISLSIKLPVAFCTELKQKFSQFVRKHNRP